MVELLGTLRKQAVEFNSRQPPTVVHLESRQLRAQLADAHARDQQLARRLAESITIGGERGVRPTRSLNLAIHTYGHGDRPDRRAAVYAWPLGEPADVQIRYVSDDSIESAEALYESAFGTGADTADLYCAMLPEVLASLLGFEVNEIEVVD
ncbi:hypothetical protein ACQ86B_27130 [Mycolicibacterium aichiense]|uniref:hypothetical protein n=1 Tax=Mycolicibacterium aichiense TaxID=1799 RepID=UPI003D66E497